MVPRSLSSISELLGSESAARLSAVLGGTCCYVPVSMTAEHPLAKLLGHEQATVLAEDKGGTTIEIPRNLGVAREKRNAEIVRRASEGEPSRDIALSLGLSQRMIRYILRDNTTEN